VVRFCGRGLQLTRLLYGHSAGGTAPHQGPDHYAHCEVAVIRSVPPESTARFAFVQENKAETAIAANPCAARCAPTSAACPPQGQQRPDSSSDLV